MKDVISVIIPIFNMEKYLSKCLDSILNQTYTNLEILLVNDGSTDNSPAICKKYADKDSRIKIINKENGGSSSARNKGLDCSTGAYIMFMDSDDYVHPDFVQKCYTAAIRDDADLVVCNYVCVNEKGETTEYSHRLDNQKEQVIGEKEYWEEYYASNQNGYYIVPWNRLVKKEIYENLRYIGTIYEDERICHEIIARCKRISCLEDRLYYYLQREGSIVHQKCTEKDFNIIDAMLARSIHFKDAGFQNLADQAFALIVGRMIGITKELDMKKEENKVRYKELKKEYNKAFVKIIRGGVPSSSF